MSKIIGAPITVPRRGKFGVKYTYTGAAGWADQAKSVLELKTGGVLTFAEEVEAEVFLV